MRALVIGHAFSRRARPCLGTLGLPQQLGVPLLQAFVELQQIPVVLLQRVEGLFDCCSSAPISSTEMRERSSASFLMTRSRSARARSSSRARRSVSVALRTAAAASASAGTSTATAVIPVSSGVAFAAGSRGRAIETRMVRAAIAATMAAPRRNASRSGARFSPPKDIS